MPIKKFDLPIFSSTGADTILHEAFKNAQEITPNIPGKYRFHLRLNQYKGAKEMCSQAAKWWLLIWILSVVVVVMVGGAMQRDRTKTVDAEQIILRDGEGRVRARLAVIEHATASLTLTDENGKSSLKLSMSRNGESGISFLGKDGSAKWTIDGPSDGPSTINFFDGKGRNRFKAGLFANGSPVLAMSDQEERLRFKVSVSEVDGTPLVSLLDSKSETRLTVGLYNNEKKGIKNDIPTIALYGDRQNALVHLLVSEGKSWVLLRGGGEETSLEAPKAK